MDANSGTHACPPMLPCVSVSASLAYSEERDGIASRFSVLVHACVCVWESKNQGLVTLGEI